MSAPPAVLREPEASPADVLGLALGVDVSPEAVRLELGDRRSRAFAWAIVGIDAIDAPARAAGFVAAERWQCERRWFARLAAAQ